MKLWRISSCTNLQMSTGIYSTLDDEKRKEKNVQRCENIIGMVAKYYRLSTGRPLMSVSVGAAMASSLFIFLPLSSKS